MSHPRIEEVSDSDDDVSDPSEGDIDDFRDSDILRAIPSKPSPSQSQARGPSPQQQQQHTSQPTSARIPSVFICHSQRFHRSSHLPSPLEDTLLPCISRLPHYIPKPLTTHQHTATMSTENGPVMITLQSNDNHVLTVEKPVAERSMLIKNLLEDLGEGAITQTVPIPNVSEPVLRKVIEWCEHHRNDPPSTNEDESDNRKKTTDIDEWDQKFMQVDQEMLFEIILASNYLDIKPLLDVGCKTVANMIKGKSPEEIRKTFNITNDFTPEEEEQIRRENEWAEDR
ncbi:hypothetical protein NUW58_g192 [Xylaria curta]|uniref:Uncharacterized protein n=1 Tax=Xylaria curta TaxID=42375 RepID=A0ACC1PSN9_9PEZI|nr:hypothetical protein NUW58_g192 [Xylaria curta]